MTEIVIANLTDVGVPLPNSVSTASIQAQAVTYAKIQAESAVTMLGNPTGAPASPSEITLGAAFTFVGQQLRTVAFTGDVTTAANSVATTIAANAVTYAKMQTVTAARLLGNPTGGAAVPSEITLGATLAFVAAALQTVALSGDVTSAANSFSTTIAANAVTGGKIATNTVANSNLAQMAANTIKGNNTGGVANAADLTIIQVSALFTKPTRQVFTSGAATYTTPANVTWIEVDMVGGGGGGQGSGTTPGSGGAGGNTTFGTSLLTCNGGAGGNSTVSTGGTATGGDINITGGIGEGAVTTANFNGGMGGNSAYGGNGPGGANGQPGNAASTNSGSGGGGGGNVAAGNAGSGGGGGGYLNKIILGPLATYAYNVGAAGSAGTAGTGGSAGGAGALGFIVVTEHYSG